MSNERLRSSIAAAQLSVIDVAAHVRVDPKTVERWITGGRLPHRGHRWTTASLLRTDEAYLWPEVASDARTTAASEAEFVTLYPHRGAVPPTLWAALIEGSSQQVDVLVYAGLFLTDGTYADLPAALARQASSGTRVRLMLGDPESQAVARRGEEERIGPGLAARIRMSLTYLQEAHQAPGVELRLHETTLYASLYRFDDDLLVNAHVYGAPAAQSPVLHLRRVPGGRLVEHYARSFERVWEQARLLPPG